MGAMKNLAKRLLRSAGFELKRIEELPEPTPVYEDFHEACRRKNFGEPAAFLCPIDKIVTVNGFSFLHAKSWHPFVETLQEFIASGQGLNYRGSVLEKFYRRWQPKNALEALIGATGPALLSRYPAYAIHSPWLDIDPQEHEAVMEPTTQDESRLHNGPQLGHGLHGPVTARQGQLEYQRLIQTFHSIQHHGYDRRIPGHDMNVVALEHKGRYRFCIGHGRHRVPALAVLGYQTVPVSITRVIHSSEIVHWPQVYRKRWTQEEALDYIEHLFTFDARAWAARRNLLGHYAAAGKTVAAGLESQRPT